MASRSNIDRVDLDDITAANVVEAAESLPRDMAADIREAIREGRASVVEASVVRFNGAASVTTLIYYPEIGTGAACDGGDSVWMDAGSMGDLIARWAEESAEGDAD